MMNAAVPEKQREMPVLEPGESAGQLESWLARVTEFEGRELASDERMRLAELATAVVRSALRECRPEGRWHYFRFEVGRGAGKTVVTDVILPLIEQLQTEGAIEQWWWLHKPDISGSHFRLRVKACSGHEARVETEVTECLEQALEVRVAVPVYEPEIGLFGGAHGIELAHEFFSRDSEFLARWLRLEGDEPAERRARVGLSVLLLRHLLDSAGLDVFEQWNVWERVWEKRQAPKDILDLEAAVPWAEKLIIADTAQIHEMYKDEKRELVREFADYLKEFGANLCRVYSKGKLECGLRHFIATAVLFHWSRLEFHYFVQARVSRIMADCTDPRI